MCQHLREHWVSTVVLGLAEKISQLRAKKAGKGASFCVWGKEKAEVNMLNRIDPNYLVREQFAQCPFHCGLHKFALANPDTPLLHIDVHGKKDDFDNGTLELGIKPL